MGATSNLANVFLFVTLLGKQLASQEGLVIGWQKFKGNSRGMGWMRQGAGGDLDGSGLLLSPAVMSMSSLTEGQPQGQKAAEEEREEREDGVQIQAIDRRSLEEGR